jgi:hypothetical protein
MCTSAGCTRAEVSPDALDGNSVDLRPRQGADVASGAIAPWSLKLAK